MNKTYFSNPWGCKFNVVYNSILEKLSDIFIAQTIDRKRPFNYYLYKINKYTINLKMQDSNQIKWIGN